MIIVKCIVAVIIVLALIFYMFPVYYIEGVSMSPTILNGDIVIGTRLFRRHSNLKEGHIYSYTCPSGYKVIKRLDEVVEVKSVSGDKKYMCFFLGDNPSNSRDSRDYGYIDSYKISSKIILYRKQQLN